ncbi:unnamed protein product [Anisakis simplex]|uniref:Uncharacterized protein n=1 Tax=Anisakis simplex TaxID=6269 RepID=A0A0M3JYB6_ANISI|nr:unnamed protein product [Anisakis simplex]
MPIEDTIAALSVAGDRRIRVHTMCIPLTTNLQTLYDALDAQCAFMLLSKIGTHIYLILDFSTSSSPTSLFTTLSNVLNPTRSEVMSPLLIC